MKQIGAPLKKNPKKAVGCRIDLFQQSKAFDYKCLTQPGITGNYRSVYFALLSINNSKFWSEIFEVDFQYIIELSRVDKDTYRRAMDFFNENGFFDSYIKGKNKYARARVSLKVLTDNPTGNAVGNTVGDTPDNQAGNAEGNIASAAHYSKTVNNKLKKLKTFVPPTLDEVISFCKTKGCGREIATKAFEHYDIGNWHDTTGKPVGNWQQKIYTNWLNKEPSQDNKVVPLLPADIAQQKRDAKKTLSHGTSK